MSAFRHGLAVVCFLLVGCVSSEPGSSLPGAGAYARPAGGLMGVSPMSVAPGQDPAWGWRVGVPGGDWTVVCRYRTASDGDQFSAVVGFPDGTKRSLPKSAVSVACRGISEQPELDAWKDAHGRILLRLSGRITATTSEGVFAFDGHHLTGWWLREMIDPDPDTGKRKVEYEGVFAADERRIAP